MSIVKMRFTYTFSLFLELRCPSLRLQVGMQMKGQLSPWSGISSHKTEAYLDTHFALTWLTKICILIKIRTFTLYRSFKLQRQDRGFAYAHSFLFPIEGCFPPLFIPHSPSSFVPSPIIISFFLSTDTCGRVASYRVSCVALLLSSFFPPIFKKYLYSSPLTFLPAHCFFSFLQPFSLLSLLFSLFSPFSILSSFSRFSSLYGQDYLNYILFIKKPCSSLLRHVSFSPSIHPIS